MDIRIQPLYLALVILLWLVAYHVVYWGVAIARDPSLVCWSVGPFGIAIVSLRETPAGRLFVQLIAGALVVAGLAYVSFFVVTPPPVAGLNRSLATQVTAVAIPVAALTISKLFGIIRERSVRIWGEARVLTIVERSLATGARIYFTPVGRDFLRERFGATPNEFLRMVRL